jgi:hypothetical protein
MVERSPVTMEQAIRAQETLIRVVPLKDIFGSDDLVLGKPLWQSMAVTAEAPLFDDHFIEIVAPLAIDVSRIPREIDGVRIVVVHEDRPGFMAT